LRNRDFCIKDEIKVWITGRYFFSGNLKTRWITHHLLERKPASVSEQKRAMLGLVVDDQNVNLKPN
jgi:hypothetical protein